MLPKALVALSLIASSAHAFPFYYSDPGGIKTGSSYVMVKNSPTTEIQRPVPSSVEFTADYDAPSLTIHKWDIYDDAAGQIVYSFGEHEVTDLHQFVGMWWGTITKPEGVFDVSFRQENGAATVLLRPQASWYIDKSVLTFQPLYKPFRIDWTARGVVVPEPATWGLLAIGLTAAAWRRRAG